MRPQQVHILLMRRREGVVHTAHHPLIILLKQREVRDPEERQGGVPDLQALSNQIYLSHLDELDYRYITSISQIQYKYITNTLQYITNQYITFSSRVSAARRRRRPNPFCWKVISILLRYYYYYFAIITSILFRYYYYLEALRFEGVRCQEAKTPQSFLMPYWRADKRLLNLYKVIIK